MLPRLLIPLLCTSAFALACGPRSHSEASSHSNAARSANVEDTGAARRASTRAARAKHDGEVAPSLAVTTEGNAVRFALAVENAGNKRLELHFANGQTHDFVVVDSIGREVWRWGAGRMFTQAHKTKALGGGDEMRVEETWSAAGHRGQFTAVAILRSTNFPVEERASFVMP